MSNQASSKLNIRPYVERVLRQLPDRNRDILASRFGIGKEGRETLESIGRRYNITRERVRQIEEASLAKLRTFVEFDDLESIFAEIATYLQDKGGVLREDQLLDTLVPRSQAPHLSLVLHLGGNFIPLKETDDYHAVWATSKEQARTVQGILADVTGALQKRRIPLQEKELYALMQEKATDRGHDCTNTQEVLDHIQISKVIAEGPFGKHGLAHWPEINPRGVRDKAYLVFEVTSKPLHFRDIASKIDQLGLPKKSERNTHPQTVHNELIKDDRFVLVGRGMYALVKWGYKPGTVREVLVSILGEAGRPLSREDLVKRVLKQRLVQENTILLNLQNKDTFRRQDDGAYTLA